MVSSHTGGAGRSVDDLRRAAKTRGRQLKRRRRGVAGATGFTAVAVAIVTAAALTGGPDGHHEVVVQGSVPVACQGGGPAQPGEARTGAGVRFGQLPAQFTPVGNGDGPYGTRGEVASPGGSTKSTTKLQVSLLYQSVAQVSHSSSTLTVAGHPATVTVGAPLGKLADPQVTVTWAPEPNATISVIGSGVPEAQVTAAAQSVIYTPGVQAGSVGDLGTVIPRSEAIAIAGTGGGAASTPLRTVTWLTDGEELGHAEQALGGVGGSSITEMIEQNQPMWVVATLGSFPNMSETAYGNGSNGGVGRVNAAVVNGITGMVFETSQSPDATIPGVYASLADHSTRQPCPSPSPTEPGLQAPLPTGSLPAANPDTITAVVTKHGVELDSAAYQLNVGTDQKLAAGDTVYTAGSDPVLVGRITQYDETWAEVQPYIESATATTVKVDAAGDEAVAVGNGPGRPVSLYMVNHNVRLDVGQRVVTAGPIATGTPAGLLVGTVATFAPSNGDQSPTATITAALPANPTSVQVVRQNQ